MILTLDPGFSAGNATGVSLFNPLLSRLVAADVIRRDSKLEGLAAQRDLARKVVNWAWDRVPESSPYLTSVVAEWPQVYPDEREKDPNTSLLPLCGIVGIVVGLLPPEVQVHAYKPREWKGTIKGDVFVGRISDRLDPVEREILGNVLPKSLRHNAADAVGIGLKFLGRMERARVVHND